MELITQAFRQLRRLLFYTVLLSLPVTFIPGLSASIYGLVLERFHFRKIRDGTHALARELDRASWMDQFSVPRAPTIWEHMDEKEPFFIPVLHSNDWAAKLGFLFPNDYYDPSSDLSIDKLASFEGALRDVKMQSCRATQYWVYISSLAMPAVFPWDAAFVQLQEYLHAHSLPSGYELVYADCAAAPFLCNVWQVSAPALVHFFVADNATVGEEIDVTSYDADPVDLRPVQVRIFDLGLQLNTSALLPGVFPTMFEQMRSLLMHDGAYSLVDEQSSFERELDRCDDWIYERAKQRGTFLWYVTEVESWWSKCIVKPLKLEEPVRILCQTMFMISFSVASLITSIYVLASQLIQAFLGYPTEFDHLAARIEEREQAKAGGGFMGDMFDSFLDLMQAQVEANATSSDGDAPGMTAGVEELRLAFASLRQNASSILAGD